jgi:hypothetical protein
VVIYLSCEPYAATSALDNQRLRVSGEYIEIRSLLSTMGGCCVTHEVVSVEGSLVVYADSAVCVRECTSLLEHTLPIPRSSSECAYQPLSVAWLSTCETRLINSQDVFQSWNGEKVQLK